MKERQTLVVGSGAGGLTMALLLAKAGRPVTLVESQPNIGGYMRRFVRNGVSFDTGYHFSGGFDDIFGQMLEILGIRDRISSTPISNRIVLKEGEKGLILPAGRDFKITEECFCSAFPDDAAGLHQLFQTMRQIWTTRQMADLTDLTPLQWDISQYDSITVRDFCDSLGLSRAARTAAGSFATCHGTPPSVASMSFHAWIGFCLYDSLSRPFRGGDPMIAAFRQEAEKLGITIRTNARLLPFDPPDADGNCHLARFADGDPLEIENAFFTIHPLAVRSLLPESSLTRSFLRRIGRLQETNSFFCVYYLVDEGVELPRGLLSVYSENDLDAILSGRSAFSSGYLLEREPDNAGIPHNVITAFRTMPVGWPENMPARSGRHHHAPYQEFKQRTAAEITDDLVLVYPQLKGHLHIVETGSPLTCLDYDPPTGSAYGAQNICGQSRIIGQLPVKNFFQAGQSASVPGVMGTMMTSFLIFRVVMGDEIYRRVIESSSCNKKA